MPKKIYPIIHQLQRGQGYIEYMLIAVLIAVVAIPTVTLIASPANFREGLLYRQIYVPVLCAVQGRGEGCTVANVGVYNYPTKAANGELAEGGGGGGSGGGGGGGSGGGGEEIVVENPDVLEVTSLVVDGQSQTSLPPGMYSFIAEAKGGADTLTLSVTDSDSNVFASNDIAGDSEYETTPIDAFTLADVTFSFEQDGDYVITALPTKDGTDGPPQTLTITIDQSLHPDDNSQLFGAGFQVYDADTDQVETSIIDGTELASGNWALVGLTTGGTPNEVIMELTGPETRTVTVTEPPYTVFGYSDNDYTGFTLPTGDYTLTLTPYDQAGDAGTPAIVNFTVFIPDPIFVTGVNLINATENTVVGELTEGEVIPYTNQDLSVSVLTDTDGPPGTIGSVVITLEGPGGVISGADNVLETGAPYTVFGDSSGNYTGQQLAEGDYTLTATAYYNSDGTGAGSDTFTRTFSIGPWERDRIEAEDATIVGAFVVQTDGGRQYVEVPNSVNLNSTSNSNNPTVNENYVEFDFDVPEDGTYAVWAVVEGPGNQDDSFWVKHPDSNTTMRYWSALPSSWGEDRVTHDGAGSTNLAMTASGPNIVRFHLRENGTKLDWAEVRKAN
jgi:hypothetical protein